MIMMKKYSRSLDLLLAATQAYRRGDLEMSGRFFVRSMNQAGVKETLAALDQMNEHLMQKSPVMAKAIAAARKELARVQSRCKRKIVKADDVLDEDSGDMDEGLEETVEGDDSVDLEGGEDLLVDEEGAGDAEVAPDMDEDLESMLDDTGMEDDVEEDTAADDGDADADDVVEDEAKVVASKRKAIAVAKMKATAKAKVANKVKAIAIAITKAKRARRKIRSQARVTRAAKNLKALARLSKR